MKFAWKDAAKYVAAGIVGTILIFLGLGAIAILPVLPAAIASIIAAVAMVAIALFPGALLVYGIIYFRKKRKEQNGQS